MLAIVGGAIPGLTAPVSLAQSNPQSFVHALEARHRLGGTAYTNTSQVAGVTIDLRATWMCPDQNPSIMKLLKQHSVRVKREATHSSASPLEGGA